MIRGFLAFALVGSVAACATSDDPADGGFINGVSALNTGAYDARIAEREAAIDVETATQAELQAELARLSGNYDTLKLQILDLRKKATDAGASLTPLQQDRVNTTLIANPGGTTEAEKIENLRRAIADARSLANELSALSG